MRPHIVVVGSTNTDMVVRTTQLPVPGQTVLGEGFLMSGGGKGANQAVAAARLGSDVTFISSVGDDLFGRQSIDHFKAEGIDCSYIKVNKGTPSGVALISVDAKGENCILVASGANALLSAGDLDPIPLSKADIIMTQLEIPMPVVEALLGWGGRAGKKIILNPAPASLIPDDVLRHVSVLTPNEKEAEMLTGIAIADRHDALRAAKLLASKGIATVIITMGKQGALVYGNDEANLIPAPVVTAIDTTAAGDVFNAALAVALSEGMTMPMAVEFANRAAALSVTRMGAQTSAPVRTAVDSFR